MPRGAKTTSARGGSSKRAPEAQTRIHAQELLREQSRVLAASFKHSITPLVFLDREFHFLRVNQAYAKACQRDVSEFPGRNHFELYPHAENQAIFREVVRTKTPYQAVAKPFTFPDHPEWGTTYWDWTLVPILDAAGEVEFLIFSLNDVTKRKEADRRDEFTKGLLELFARKSSRKEYLDSVVEMVRGWCGCRCVGIRVADGRGLIPYESITGFTGEFCEAESRLSLEKDTCACVRVIAGTPESQDAGVMTPGGSFRCDNAVQFVDGLPPGQQARYRSYCTRSGFHSLAIIPVRYHGETLGAVHVADEREGMIPPGCVEFLESMSPLIGEAIHRFSVEGQLRSAYAYARGLLEASLDPLMTISPRGQITDVNRATELITGVPRERLIGSDFLDYFTEPQMASEGYRKVISQGFVRDYPLTIRHASGRTADVLYNATVYRSEAGQVAGVLAAARDVTDAKQAEEQLRALNEVLEQRAVQLQVLAGALTQAEQRERRRLAQILHDHLQQILYAVRLGLARVKDRLADKDLQASLGQLDEWLNESIETSRSLTVDLSPPVLYDASLSTALEWLGRQIEETYGLNVEVDAGPEIDVPGEDLRVLLFEAVRELLFNVVKHADAKRARVEMARADAQRLRIVVSDRGAGFDSTKQRTGRLGAASVGLFSIRERLELFGGRMEIESAPGRGTRVVIHVPCRRPAQPAKDRPAGKTATPRPAETVQQAQPAPAGVKRIRVLLADDHKVLREGLAHLLREQPDLEVVGEAENGRRAVELALQTQPDVVVMDMVMPLLNGIEATRRIVAALPGVRVIGLSMHDDENMAGAMLQAGAIAYLPKGGSSAPLVDAIRSSVTPQDYSDD